MTADAISTGEAGPSAAFAHDAAPGPGSRYAELSSDRTAIDVRDVSKWFKDVVAVSDITCSIGYGVTALLGPNGAGKSTLFRMLCGLTPPSRGSIQVLGGNPRKDIALTRNIGLVPQQETLFEPLSAFEFVRLAGILHGLSDPGAAAVDALDIVELDPRDPRPLTTYSKGMRQRVKVAQALVHDPEILFLDEPLTGLDPRQRLHMVDAIQRLGRAGKCVVVSSHVLEEVERFSARVLVIVKGRLAAEGDYHAIRDLMDDRPHRISIRVDDPQGIASGLLDHNVVSGVQLLGPDTLMVETVDVQSFRHVIATVAAERQTRLYDVVPLDDDLESVFRYLVGR
jgi:ABC-2 type transport system ATP-binding protein